MKLSDYFSILRIHRGILWIEIDIFPRRKSKVYTLFAHDNKQFSISLQPVCFDLSPVDETIVFSEKQFK